MPNNPPIHAHRYISPTHTHTYLTHPRTNTHDYHPCLTAHVSVYAHTRPSHLTLGMPKQATVSSPLDPVSKGVLNREIQNPPPCPLFPLMPPLPPTSRGPPLGLNPRPFPPLSPTPFLAPFLLLSPAPILGATAGLRPLQIEEVTAHWESQLLLLLVPPSPPYPYTPPSPPFPR